MNLKERHLEAITATPNKTGAKVISITKQMKEDRSDIYKSILNRKME